MKGKNEERKLSPLVGESVNRQVDERGKLEQTRKNGNKREGKNLKTIFTCVRTHAPFASQARHFSPYAGEADTKEKRVIVFYKNNELIACHFRMK